MITSRVYMGCLYSSMMCLVLDILSVIGIVYRNEFPAHLPEFICKSYLASLVLVSLIATIYISTTLSFRLHFYKKLISVFVVFGIVIEALIYLLPITMCEIPEESLVWTEGPSCYATYVGVFLLILINLIQIFRHSEYIFPRQRTTVIIWMFVWLGAAVIQAMNSHLLVVGFGCALGIATVFAQFENPELNMDRATGLFNYAAFNRYAEQLYGGTKDFYVIAVVFENAAWQYIGDPASVTKMFNAFLEIPGASAFKIMEKQVLLFFTKHEQVVSAWDSLMQRPKTKETEATYYLIENPRCGSSQRDLIELLQYVSIQKKVAKPGSFYVIHDDIVSEMVAQRMMTQQIFDALAEDRVVVYYQPIYSIEKKRFTSAEALVRIIDRDGKLILPGEFINIAENNGMITEIGKRVFEKVCRFFRENDLQNYGMQYIEVNLSVVQCADEKLADNYIKIMNDTKLDPAYINLEITESASVDAKQVLIANMERMIEYGISFSLDDFGTGASNLNYIVDMPVKLVKFDREMSRAYFTSRKAKYVMDAAMHMIHGMGLEIVAEGIETEEQYNMMEKIKIDYIQGYYFSKPLSEQDFLELLRQE
ncbi:MAG: EAL domain-containing protein [Eubacterium sp.]|nr:EAL domain-containing protein [Eubacterium sp.]